MEFKLIEKAFLLMFLCNLVSCTSFIRKEYISSKKYPNELPNYILKFENNEEGQFVNLTNQIIDSEKGKFIYYKNKIFLIISSIDSNDFLNKNDTLVFFRNKLYFFNKKHKVVFEER